MSTQDFAAWMGQIQSRTETALDRVLPPAHIAPQRLHTAMRYAVLGGGKRVRPLLVHAAGRVAGAAPERLDRAACAVELIHAYSLVHDDMPCMDDDSLRRGKPTVHVQFDEATALLVGDALQSLAFQVLAADLAAEDAAGRVAMLHLLAQAAGSRGMAGGQALDLANVGQSLSPEDLEFMHVRKTGALIRAAVLLGAHCGDGADAAVLERLDHYARAAGLLFQVVDDILDCSASTATLGKTAGKDQLHDKPTYASLLGLAQAREFAAELHARARESLADLGDRAQGLAELTDFIARREF
ncbi:MAG: polyprenyl synthetase family protein [Rhodocyclaceae bacterium]|nr:polyprenyl synthetase family protein [Rhodocyclaceae bacterium]MBX3667402.1 polyprenyl synthetase family protein [Rhodocyclaceae bacterium]